MKRSIIQKKMNSIEKRQTVFLTGVMSAAVTNTQLEKAMAALAQSIDTAGMPALQNVQPWERANISKKRMNSPPKP